MYLHSSFQPRSILIAEELKVGWIFYRAPLTAKYLDNVTKNGNIKEGNSYY